jgi:hypothetical protein
MLKGLETIDWKNIAACSGYATNLPNIIKMFLSKNASVHAEAYEEFYDVGFCQQIPCEAVRYALPFFLELLESPEVESKAFILSILANIALIGSDDELLLNWKQHSNKDLAQEVIYQYDLVRQGIKIFAQLLNDNRPNVRIAATRILGILKEDGKEAAQWLYIRIQNEQDMNVMASLIEAITLLVMKTPRPLSFIDKYIQYCENLLKPQYFGILRVASAMSLAQIQKGSAPLTVEAILFEAAVNSILFDDFCGGRISTVTKICEVLWQLGLQRSIPYYRSLIEIIADEELLHSIFYEMMNLLFPIRQIDVIGLTENQKIILASFLGKESLWEKFNLGALLSQRGLPVSVPQLKKLVQASSTSEGNQ